MPNWARSERSNQSCRKCSGPDSLAEFSAKSLAAVQISAEGHACAELESRQASVPFKDTEAWPALRTAGLHLHYGTQDFAALHFVEGRFYVAEANSFADKAVERQAALQVELDEHGEVA
jgi:hypothetical protein